MDTPESEDSSAHEIGAIEFNTDGELVYWDGHTWKPYQKLPSGEPSTFRGAQAATGDQ